MLRRLALSFLVFAFAWILIARFTELSELASMFARGAWLWVVAAAWLQFLSYTLQAGVYQLSFSAVRVKSRLRELIPVLFASVFVNIAVPVGGMGGVALFVDNAVRHRQSAARAAAGVLLVLAVDFSAFTVLLGVGLAYLSMCGGLCAYQLTAAAILMAIICGLSAAFLLGLWKPWILLRVLKLVQRGVNDAARWLRRDEALPNNWAARHAMDFSAASAAIAETPLRLSGALGVALLSHLVSMASLYALFLAFGHPVGPGVLVAGYAMGNLFWIVSLTPQGVGVVEGVMTLVYSSMGVPIAAAAAVVFSYRGLGFWLPMLAGFALLRGLRLFRGNASAPATGADEYDGTVNAQPICDN